MWGGGSAEDWPRPAEDEDWPRTDPDQLQEPLIWYDQQNWQVTCRSTRVPSTSFYVQIKKYIFIEETQNKHEFQFIPDRSKWSIHVFTEEYRWNSNIQSICYVPWQLEVRSTVVAAGTHSGKVWQPPISAGFDMEAETGKKRQPRTHKAE